VEFCAMPDRPPTDILSLFTDTVDLPKVEIFRAGDYGPKGKYTPETLADIASRYDPAVHDAPITTDHRMHGPAYGWARKVWAEGEKLFASFTKVPRFFADLVQSGRYAKRSAEIWTDFNNSGKPYLKAVTFLGAATPHVAGMEELFAKESKLNDHFFTFSAEQGESHVFEVACCFYDIVETEDPFPELHGQIVREEECGSRLGHSHICYLDKNGNGFTSLAFKWIDGPDYYGRQVILNSHRHQVKNGVILGPSPEGGIDHTHSLTVVKNSNFSLEGGITAMPQETDKKPTTPPADASELDRLRAENADLKTQVSAFQKEKADLTSKVETFSKKLGELETTLGKQAASTAFDAAWGKLEADNKVLPAEKDEAKKFYLHLVDQDSTVVSFGKESPKVAEAYLKQLEARTPHKVFSVQGDNREPLNNQGGQPGDRAERREKKAQEFKQKNPSWTMLQCFEAVDREFASIAQ
jgi:hypothetical protein